MGVLRVHIRPLRTAARPVAGVALAAALATCGVVALGEEPDEETCWASGTPFSFERCCRDYGGGATRGHPSCWLGSFTFERCCLPEIGARLEGGLGLIESGEFRRASDVFFELAYNYARTSPEYWKVAWSGFQKAAKEFRNTLDAAPHSLSYFEVLFRGLNIECDPLPRADAAVAPAASRDPYTEFARCCSEDGVFGHKGCNAVFEMMANALGRGRHRGVPTKSDSYYGNMSELWAFHHFTPSVLLSTDAKDPPKHGVEAAYGIDAELAQTFERAGEPALGIVWADHVFYRSQKFTYGVYFLTLLFALLRRAGAARAVEVFEIGAGFGSLPRLLALARPGLLAAADPINVRRYTIWDVRSVIDLQRWYLNKTVGSRVVQRDWSAQQAGELWRSCEAGGCWGASAGAGEPPSDLQGPAMVPPLGAHAPLHVDFVDTDARDFFAHLYAHAHAPQESGGAKLEGSTTRVLVAVNSWHEFTMVDFLWHYNAFVAAPVWRMGVDWILYVSNREWEGSAAKEALLLRPGRHFRFEVRHEECTAETCVRILQRVL